MRTRRFENTLREREAVAVGARCRSLGFCSDALLCLCASVPARPSGEQPPPVGARPSRGAGQCAGPSYPCPRPRRAGPAGVILRPPGGWDTAPQRSRAWVRSRAVRRRAPAGF